MTTPFDTLYKDEVCPHCTMNSEGWQTHYVHYECNLNPDTKDNIRITRPCGGKEMFLCPLLKNWTDILTEKEDE